MLETYEPIVLVGQNGNALHPFPCPVNIQSRTDPPQGDNPPYRYFAIVCGDAIMAKYKELAPAKLEVNRLLTEWDQSAETRPRKFQFVKDVKEDL